MDTISNQIPKKTKLSPWRIASSSLFFVFAILSLLSAFTMSTVHFQNFQQISSDAPIYEFQYPNLILLAYFELFRFVSSIIAPALAISAALFGFVTKRRWLQAIIGSTLFIIVFPISWVWQLWSSGLVMVNQSFAWTQNSGSFVSVIDFQDTLLGWVSLAFIIFGVIASIGASVFSPKKFVTVAEENAPPVTNIVQVSEASSATSSPQSNLNNLPLFALIGAFVIPLAGIILGHLSLSYMKKGQLSDQNKGMAKIGLILGYVFVGLGFLVGLIIAVVLVVTAVNREY